MNGQNVRTYFVFVEGADCCGTLELDMARTFHQRWRWRSASGAVEGFFPTKTDAKDHIAWLNRCRSGDVRMIEQQEEAST
jgi:hypothetical protein